jgi:hypothetical protein
VKVTLRISVVLLSLLFTVSAADYFPVAVGNEWYYTFPLEGLAGYQRMVIEQKNVVDTDTIFHVNVQINVDIFKDSLTGYFVSVENDVYSFDSMDETKPYDKTFEHQPVEGREWTLETGENRKIVNYGSITVAAGTFSSCYAIVEDGDTTEVYAPDVGLVASLLQGEIAMQLVSYTIASLDVARFIQERETDGNHFFRTGFRTGDYSAVNLQGRRVTGVNITGKGWTDQKLSSGIYIISPESGRDRVVRRCVAGRQERGVYAGFNTLYP